MENKNTGYLIYAGQRNNGNMFFYYKLEELSINDGKYSADKLIPFKTNTKLFKIGSIGHIYKVDFLIKDNLPSVSYNTKENPVDFWKNEQDRATWKAHDVAVATFKELKRKGSHNDIKILLEPIRQAYKECQTTDQQRAILAEVIRIICQP